MRKRMAFCLLITILSGVFAAAFAETPAVPAEATAPAAIPFGAPIDGAIRVLLQSLGARTSLGLTIAGAYSVDGDRGFQFQPGTEIKLGLDGGNIILQAGGAIIDMGGGFTLVRHLDASGKAGGIYIHESEKDTLYCGDMTLGARGGSLRAIVSMNMEDYLYGVVPYEMSDTFPLEALKAQAVAARTYAMQRKERNADQEYDLVDTTNDQVFKGLDSRFEKPIQAVDETRGIVGRHAGGFAECFYSASNGGQTALAKDVWGKGDFGYLDMRDDPYDLENPESVVKTAAVSKNATVMKEALYALLVERVGIELYEAGVIEQGEAVGLSEVVHIEAVNPLYGGGSRQYGTIRFTVRVSVRKLTAPEGGEPRELGEIQTLEEPITVDLSFYNEVRQALGIGINASDYELVTVTETEKSFTLTTRRYGHGVGLSQRGAQRMAGAYGMGYREILNFYYPGLRLYAVTWLEKPLALAASLPESLGYAASRPTPAPTPGPLPALEEGEYYAVVSIEGVDSTLNVREGPSMDDRVVSVLRTGSRLIVMEEVEGGWARMKTAEIEGFVSIAFIKREAEIVRDEAEVHIF
ncbi:MAG: SpoIID/LytB domain-containing protein [Firmicutes bacterium]|nr:SpoIID/LytB domain-containing protein [Bacillota bacterium]